MVKVETEHQRRKEKKILSVSFKMSRKNHYHHFTTHFTPSTQQRRPARDESFPLLSLSLSLEEELDG